MFFSISTVTKNTLTVMNNNTQILTVTSGDKAKTGTKTVTADVTHAMRRYKRWLKLSGAERKKYQARAVKWALRREKKLCSGGILADEMGLGKSFVMMGLVAASPLQTLFIVPPALLDQWKDMLTQYLHPPAIFHGLAKKKAEKQGKLDKQFKSSPIILTTYYFLGHKRVKNKEWQRVIYDEAHHLRNNKSKKFKNAKALKAEKTWFLTGTPIQNRISDFHSLCDVLKIPKTLSRGKMTEIRKVICLKRTKNDVGLKLPKLSIHRKTVEWATERERQFAIDLHSFLRLTNVNRRNVTAIVNSLNRVTKSTFPAIIRARQVCILPELVQKNLQKWIDIGEIDAEWLTNGFISSLSTSKLDAICETIKKRDNGRPKLIFCHFRGEIDELQKRLKNHYSVGVIDGRTGKKQRRAILNSHTNFNTEICNKIINKIIPDRGTDFIYRNINRFLTHDVVILQIQTCCEGLNLQQFQEVYFTTPHWNPAVEDQAIARCHRKGQHGKVDVFKFFLEFKNDMSTMDQYCEKVQQTKRELW